MEVPGQSVSSEWSGNHFGAEAVLGLDCNCKPGDENTALLAEAEEFSSREEFLFFSILRWFCPATLTGYSEVIQVSEQFFVDISTVFRIRIRL